MQEWIADWIARILRAVFGRTQCVNRSSAGYAGVGSRAVSRIFSVSDWREGCWGKGARRPVAITVMAGLRSRPVDCTPDLMHAAVVVPEPLHGSRTAVASLRWPVKTADAKASVKPA